MSQTNADRREICHGKKVGAEHFVTCRDPVEVFDLIAELHDAVVFLVGRPANAVARFPVYLVRDVGWRALLRCDRVSNPPSPGRRSDSRRGWRASRLRLRRVSLRPVEPHGLDRQWCAGPVPQYRRHVPRRRAQSQLAGVSGVPVRGHGPLHYLTGRSDATARPKLSQMQTDNSIG